MCPSALPGQSQRQYHFFSQYHDKSEQIEEKYIAQMLMAKASAYRLLKKREQELQTYDELVSRFSDSKDKFATDLVDRAKIYRSGLVEL